MIKKWLIFGLAVGVFASCSQEGNEPNSTAEVGGETVSFSLSAEVLVDDPNLRAIDYKLGNNANGELVPMPQFTDKQEVEVHTILKSSNGAVAAKTLKWRYSAASKKLVLSQNDGHSITVSNFNNDNGVKWYVSGLIGGELIPNTTRVTFAGERVLKGVDGNEDDIVGSLNVPYAFGWTELTINTSDARDADDSHQYALVPPTANVKFVPRGSLIAYKLGNALTSGSYTFSPNGFTVATNTWGDQGEFELSTDIPTASPEKTLPLWTESSCGANMYYTFADGYTPSAIAHNGIADKTYYAWVISHKEQPTTAEVRVMLKGESSRPETATYKDYTKTYFTDYSTEGKTTQGRVTQGKVHKLTAKATSRLALPIEYVTDYNLAGGEGLTHKTTNWDPQPPGVTGPLRFADNHNNDQSGYYSAYKLLGIQDSYHNRDGKNLQSAIDGVFGINKYFVPDNADWAGVTPGSFIYWDSRDEPNDKVQTDAFAVRSEERRMLLLGQSHYSRSISANEMTLYAIRFNPFDGCFPAVVNRTLGYDLATGQEMTSKPHYLVADRSLTCAYRYRLVGGAEAWSSPTNQNVLSNRFIVDVVYLGEDATSTTLDDISNEGWWSSKEAESAVIRKIFPAAGSMNSGDPDAVRLEAMGRQVNYYSSSFASANHLWILGISARGISPLGAGPPLNSPQPVRLFKRRP